MTGFLAETPKDQEMIDRLWKEYKKLRKKSFIRDVPSLIAGKVAHPG